MIKFLDLHKINARFESDFKSVFDNFLSSGHYILGDALKEFETSYADYCGVQHCLGTSNGLDALTLIFKGLIELGRLKEGDEVLVPANTFIASFLSVLHANLIPVFVEPDNNTYNLSVPDCQQKITQKTKAVLPVHLYGQLADMGPIMMFAKQHNLIVVEDAAQAHGAADNQGRKAGSFGVAAAFSFYPTKNLGALGDGGAITTHDADLAAVLAELRNYGSNKKYENNRIGFNARLDSLQAAFLSVKLNRLDADNVKRRTIAKRYLAEIVNPKVQLPSYGGSDAHVFYAFVVRVVNRPAFMNYLKQNGIDTMVHYPIPPHKQKALQVFSELSLPITTRIHDEIVSLPISPVMDETEIQHVIKTVNSF